MTKKSKSWPYMRMREQSFQSCKIRADDENSLGRKSAEHFLTEVRSAQSRKVRYLTFGRKIMGDAYTVLWKSHRTLV